MARYHKETVKSFLDVLGATGLATPKGLKPWYVMKRVGPGEVLSYHKLDPVTEPGGLLAANPMGPLAEAWGRARADCF